MKSPLSQFGWKVTTFILCCYGFLKEFRPSEPYLYEYEHCTLNISEHILNSAVYPIWTYSYMVMLVPTFILTDLFLYKPVLIFEALSYIVVWCLFVFGSSVAVQQTIEVFYGWATATEIAYTAYIYVKVERREFKRVTSITQAALQGGRFSAYALSQLIILLKWGSYETLNWISLISLFISLPFAVLLPMISWRQAYEKKLDARGLEKSKEEIKQATYKTFAVMHFSNMYHDFKEIYSNFFIAKWSLWWALASCVFYQVLNYTQTLWGTVIDVKNQKVYNGLTEAAVPMFCIPVVLLMHKVNVDWPRYGELYLTICSLAQGALLMLMATTSNLSVMYASYIVYRIVYQGMITIAQFNIAERLASYSYGLVFGFNTFVALVLQTILTLILVDRIGLALSIKPQFIAYSCYHFAVSFIFCLSVSIALVRRIRRFLRRRRNNSEQMSVQLHT